MEKIKILVKEPLKALYEAEIENSLEAMQAMVGGRIETLTVSDSWCYVCNEDGWELQLPDNGWGGQMFPGTAFAVGTDGDEFCSLPERIKEHLLQEQEQEHTQQLYNDWLRETSDEESQAWRENLPEEDQQLLRRWDDEFLAGLDKMSRDILAIAEEDDA